MSFIPDEFTYEAEAAPEPVVVSREEAYLTSPSPVHDSAGNNVIRFKIDSNRMLDLKSIRMYANLTATATSGTTAVPGDANTAAWMNSTYSLFSSLEIASGSGVVIERVSSADILGEIVSKMSFSNDWANTSGSFQNAQSNPFDRNNGTGLRFEIGAVKLLGLLHSDKHLVPESLGGLVISLTMAPAVQILAGRVVTDTFTFSMSNVRLHYDLIQMSQAYSEFYRQQYATKGFRLTWDTYQGHTTSTISSAQGVTLPIQISGKRTKALVTCFRAASSVIAANQFSQALHVPSAFNSYQYQIGSARYPANPVDSVARAHHECMKVSYARDNTQRECMSLTQFTNAWAAGTGAATSLTNGGWLMCVDLETLNSSDKSGILIPSTGCELLLDLTLPTVAPYRFDTFSIRTQALTILDGQVSIEY